MLADNYCVWNVFSIFICGKDYKAKTAGPQLIVHLSFYLSPRFCFCRLSDVKLANKSVTSSTWNKNKNAQKHWWGQSVVKDICCKISYQLENRSQSNKYYLCKSLNFIMRLLSLLRFKVILGIKCTCILYMHVYMLCILYATGCKYIVFI